MLSGNADAKQGCTTACGSVVDLLVHMSRFCVTVRCRPQRAWELLLQRAPAAALAAAATPGDVAGWFALAATPTGAHVRADLLLRAPLPERRRSSSVAGPGEV